MPGDGRAALLLTGGASRRFGSPKAELTVGGRAPGRPHRAAAARRVRRRARGRAGLLDAARRCGRSQPGVGSARGGRRGRWQRSSRATPATPVPRARGRSPVRRRARLLELVARSPGGRCGRPACRRRSAAAVRALLGRRRLATAHALLGDGERSMQALLDAVPVTLDRRDEWRRVASADASPTSTPPRTLPDAVSVPKPPGSLGRSCTIRPLAAPPSASACRSSTAASRTSGPTGSSPRSRWRSASTARARRPAPVTVTMRTPGNDFELAVGFCVSERRRRRSATTSPRWPTA